MPVIRRIGSRGLYARVAPADTERAAERVCDGQRRTASAAAPLYPVVDEVADAVDDLSAGPLLGGTRGSPISYNWRVIFSV